MEDSPVKLKRMYVYTLETDRYRGGALYHAIIAKAKKLQAASAIVYRALEGYGSSGELHQPSAWKICQHMPVVTEIIGDEEAVCNLRLFLDEAVDDGLVTIEDIRYDNG